MIAVGDKIPESLGLDQDGKEIKAADLLGQPSLLYFYPKDNTSGCTAQACSLRDGIEELKRVGIRVIGISKDSAKSHKSFIEKYDLPFTLIADTEHVLQETFGVWVEKSMYGRKYMGTQRTSFIIDAEGRVTHIISGKEVRTKDHADQILEILKNN
ncbi:thiol peroxidase [Porphyromonas canoris]|uniref:thioredoxin-dependent thiol peroxidase n=1 Tax=Porphyromonas canoris TaxID=36875 RepID=UPI00051DDF56|nr:thioredoxin-dependent thiol peroxidase [Porphyromonas canoris]KGL51140.1 thiol peroxidase [Porphyromonas canoris]